ncbi:tRNA threonylcarbamoyladenosine dehydratase [Deminuibacter soli]|uniref:tRNA threonylcarbamoyladenosine dehydratase n=1 Tax=Deminuibacter soli TaxID=2291815 RepID=A0A3E1NGV4_9BACT|nr:tRNA threonylcarbamoyladenosine dehydratase [Deminuibacter soli]RFM27074.1 tRNA threonylcarbamoyladenosine dehydratase [Deminuibacter soli]
MIPYWMSRSQLLLGDEKITHLMQQHVLVVGLGGVGGICAEMIARAGIGKMTIVDADVVDLSNCNRQIAALHTTAGLRKAEVLAQRLRAINPELDLTVLPQYLQEEQLEALLQPGAFSYVLDCIDTLGPKVALLRICVERGLPVASAMGAGGKTDPSQVRVADIQQSYDCKLAKYVRKRLNEKGVREGIQVVFSPEKIDEDRVIVTEKAFLKKTLIGTISYMPAIFGCTLASVAIRELMD